MDERVAAAHGGMPWRPPLGLDAYLAVPYVLDARAIQGDDGGWLCELEYEELPNGVARARSPLDALDELERKRIEYLTDCFEKGIETPTPRVALRNLPYGRIHERPTHRSAGQPVPLPPAG